MFYKHKEDIDPNLTMDAGKLDVLLKTVVNRTAQAILDTTALLPESRTVLASQLKTFISTHRSIRVLIGKYETELTLSGDAKSLVREQVEKVFAIFLIASEPNKWTQILFKNDWKKMYERYLVFKEETQNLPRHQNFLNEIWPQHLERDRNLVKVTSDEKAAVEFKFNNPGKELPLSLRGKLIDDFPTPGKILNKFRNSTENIFSLPSLDRWYWEYKFLCDYNHVGLPKLMMQHVGFSPSEESKKAHFEKEILPTLAISYTASICACTEAYRIISPNAHVAGELTVFWKELERFSLLGKVFWNLHGKRLLPCL